MPMKSDTPSFAVIGAVNHGKSSVVSTLSEDDAIRVTPVPGETVDVKRFRLGELLVFYDTPGFQNARKALAEIQAAPASADPLARFRDFAARHDRDPDFQAECRLLEPILRGAGIIYVVDGSLPVTDLHRCELELVRLTGAPRLAIINRTGEPDHAPAWRAALAQTFNAVREFDAHVASFEDRKDLLEALANIERAWKPSLMKAIDVLVDDRRSRIADAAAIAAGLLHDALTHAKREPIDTRDETARRAAALALLERFKADVAGIELRAHDALIALFAHHLVSSPGASKDLFGEGLFSAQTWRLLGLDRRQLVAASAMAGGIAGAGLDLFTAGHTLLLGSVLGAAVGAGGAWLVGKGQPQIAVSMGKAALPAPLRLVLSDKQRLSANERVVGPFGAINFPWILLDRAICTLVYVAGRTHARRDAAQVQVDELLPRLAQRRLTVAHWPEEDRKRCEQVFAAWRKGHRPPDEVLRALKATIERHFSQAIDSAP
jgi:hypothetical protein